MLFVSQDDVEGETHIHQGTILTPEQLAAVIAECGYISVIACRNIDAALDLVEHMESLTN